MPPAGLGRRLLCFVYEGVVLFGVVMLAGLMYGTATGQRHALQGMHGLQAFIFVVIGAYFVGFWSRVGQTLPMRTWHILLLDSQGHRVSAARATLRYGLSWAWFVPALAAVQALGLRGGAAVSMALVGGVLGYAALAMLCRDRQFLHDRLCGTRLVDTRPQRQGITATPTGAPP